MTNRRKIAVLAVSATAAALLMGVSTFADSRPENESWRNGGQRGRAEDGYRGDRDDDRGYRDENGRRDDQQRSDRSTRYQEGRRISTTGTIRSFNRERDGYRVWMDGGAYPYWIPTPYLRGRQLRPGLSLRLGGIFRSGLISVDFLGWPGDSYNSDPYYDGRYGQSYDVLRGWVERVDYRRQIAQIREEGRRGRTYTVDFSRVDRRSRRDLRDLRRGDYLELSGVWSGRTFVASEVQSVDAR